MGQWSDTASTRLGYASAFIAALLFGSISTVAKPALSNVDPILLSAVIYLLAFMLLTPVARVNTNGKAVKFVSISRKTWLLIASSAMSGSIIAPCLYFIGLVNAKASDAAILSNAEVAFTVLIAIIVFKERFKLFGYLAIALVIIGALIVTTNLDVTSISTPDIEGKGIFMILVAMAFWALDNNLSKIASRRIEVARLVQLRSLIGGMVLLVFTLINGISFSGITAVNLPSILLLGFGGVGASMYFFLHSLKRIGTTRTMMIYSTSAIFGLVLAFIFLNESISIYQVVASSLMIVGIYVIETSEARNGR